MLLMTCAALALVCVTAQAQPIPAMEAAKHVGERATVCGKVASEHSATSSRGAPTFINLDAPYPNQVFTILIWGEDRQRIGDLPADGTRACATGPIQLYRGVPEIVVKNKSQLSQ
jgi:hypothetical protein